MAGCELREVARPAPRAPRRVRPISRVLSSADAPCRSFLSEHDHSCPLAAYPQRLGRGGRLSLPIWPCSGWGLPCHDCCQSRGGLLPHLFTLTRGESLHHVGGVFSVALSVAGRRVTASLRPGITWQPAQWSPDFPRRQSGMHLPTRPPGRARIRFATIRYTLASNDRGRNIIVAPLRIQCFRAPFGCGRHR